MLELVVVVVLLTMVAILMAWVSMVSTKVERFEETQRRVVEEIELNESLRKTIEILRGTPVDGASDRVHDRWSRPE